MGALDMGLVLTFFSLLPAVTGEGPGCAPRPMLVYGATASESLPSWHSINFCTGKTGRHLNEFCVVEEFNDDKPIKVMLGSDYEPSELSVRSAKSCMMRCVCIKDGGCGTGNSVMAAPTCFPGLVWNHTSCQCELRKPKLKAKACTGKSSDWLVHEGEGPQEISINLFIFALVVELLLVVSVSFCVVNRTCRRRSRELSRQLSQQMTDTRREVTRQLSHQVGGVSRQQSERLMDDPEPDDYDVKEFTAR